MAAAKAKIPFNPVMIRWAREWNQYSFEDVAKHLNIKPEKIQSWEIGDKTPTVGQARKFAEFCHRSFLELFRDQPPPEEKLSVVPDFRLHKDQVDPHESRELKFIQAWAEEQRLNALDLFEIVGDVVPPAFPTTLFATTQDDVEFLTTLVRDEANFSIDDQLALKSIERHKFPKLMRNALERLGILVLKESQLSKYGVRGLCIFASPLPVIVYGAEAPAAQAFTMAHELGHIILKQSAISGPPSAQDDATPEKQIERWCDKFAAAFLVPSGSLNDIWTKPNSPLAEIGDDQLSNLARRFSVSQHAMLLRLMQLGYVENDFYWKIKRSQFLKQEANLKSGGRSDYYGSRYKSSLGDMYTGLVLEAWNADNITNHKAGEFMGIKNLRHLNDIRDKFQPA